MRAFVLSTVGVQELDQARDRHARWLARWGAPEVEDRLEVTGGQTVLRELVAALPDLLVAIGHALERDSEVAVGAFLGVALALHHVGPVDRIEPLARQILPSGHETWRVHRARIVLGARPEVLREIEEGLRDAPGPRADLARIRVWWQLGRVEECRAASQTLVAALRSAGDAGLLAHALFWAGRVDEGSAVAEQEAREGLALCLQRGNVTGEVRARVDLGWASLRRGDRQSALEEARSGRVVHRPVPGLVTGRRTHAAG